MKKLLLFLSVLMFLQCKTNTGKQSERELPEIDVSRNYPEKVMYLQDIAKVEYIPLETNDIALMSNYAKIFYVSDNYIITANIGEGDVIVFDGKGKSKFSFNKKGQSGTEYNNMQTIAFDEKAKEVFISNWVSSTNRTCLVYTEDGKFKRVFSFPDNLLPREMYSFDDETLFVYDEFGMLQGENYSNKPYSKISKMDGSVVETLNIHLPVRMHNRIVIEISIEGQQGWMPVTSPISYHRSYGNNFLIADWSSDTIYRLTPRMELQPMIVRTPSLLNSDPKTVLSNELVTDKFIFFTKAVFDFEMAKRSRLFPPVKSLMYDFQTGQLNEYKLINKDFEAGEVVFNTSITPGNTGVYILDVPQLFEADEAGKLKGELKQLLKSLDIEDNPVLVKVTFNHNS